MRSPLAGGILAIAGAGVLASMVLACRGEPGIARTRSADVARARAQLGRTHGLLLSRYELTFDAVTDGRHPDDVVIDARFTAPSGKVTLLGGFHSRGHFKVRFTPRETGIHTWTVRVTQGATAHEEVRRGELDVSPSSRRGFVRVDPAHRHRLMTDEGATVFVLGENRFNVYDPRWNHEGADIRTYLERMASHGMTTIRVAVLADCESETTPGGYQIGCLEPMPGRFDERTAEAFDTLFEAAESTDIDVVLVAFANGFTPGAEPLRSWEDNPYSKARGGPARSARELFSSPALRAHAARKLQYIADRWASSPRLLAIDLLDEPERDGPIGERTWIPWAEAMSEAWRSFDPYGHLVTAGPVGLHWNVDGDERPWYSSPANDLTQWHLHGKEVHDSHALADAMTTKVKETWDFESPVICGAFAYGGEDGTTYDHTHVGLWSLALSGAGALAHSAPPFDTESDEPMTPTRASHFEVLSTLLRSLDPRRVYSPRSDAQIIAPEGARLWSLATDEEDDRVLWILGPKTGYGDRVVGATVAISAPRGGRYRVGWIDDTTGERLSREANIGGGRETLGGDGHVLVSASDDDVLVLEVPPFTRHVAARISHVTERNERSDKSSERSGK